MKFFPNKVTATIGEIHIVRERCKGCGFCVTYCPKDVLELSKEYNPKGYHYVLVVNPDKCINCGLCEMLCPDFAIWNTLKEKKEILEIK
jgi:2-oxoglutarate ferredoxin oxidoreductase subunit delta